MIWFWLISLLILGALTCWIAYCKDMAIQDNDIQKIKIKRLESEKELMKMSAIEKEKSPLFLQAYKKRFEVEDVTVLYSDNLNNKLCIEDQENKILALVNCDTRTITAYKKDTYKSVKIKY